MYKNSKESNEQELIPHKIQGFPGWEMVVSKSGFCNAHATGYAILGQRERNDCMIINVGRTAILSYVAMILKKHELDVLHTFSYLYILHKTDSEKFTVLGQRRDGKNQTLGMAIIHDFSKTKAVPYMVPHHPDGDPTNDLHVIAVSSSVHGSFHGFVRQNTSFETIKKVASCLNSDLMEQYYTSPENYGNYSHKTYDICRQIHMDDYFSQMSPDDFNRLINAVKSEFYK